METRRLAYFAKIVECGSISSAARELGIAQPALSQQLAILEHEVKVALFVRSRAGTMPTPAGLRLYERAKRIVREVSSLERDLGDDGRGGVAAVGLVPSVMPVLGMPLLRGMRRSLPRLLPQIIEAPGHALRELLARGLVDVAVLPTSLVSRELETVPLYRDRLDILSARSRKIDPDSPRDLAALPWVVTRAPNAVRNVISAWFARHGLEPNVIAEVDALPLVIDTVRADFGVTLLSTTALPSAELRAELRATPMPGQLFERTFIACWLRNAPPPAAAQIVEMLVEIGARVAPHDHHP